MSFAIQVDQVTDITNKWELAQRMSGHSKAPEEALKSVFIGAIQSLEEISKTKFDSSMKERVWNIVSEAKLITLKETFILELCEKILGDFSEDEASIMLEEHKRLGAVKIGIYCSQIQRAFTSNQESVIDSLVKKANSMTKEWIPQIVDAVKKEGIKLPNSTEFYA